MKSGCTASPNIHRHSQSSCNTFSALRSRYRRRHQLPYLTSLHLVTVVVIYVILVATVSAEFVNGERPRRHAGVERRRTARQSDRAAGRHRFIEYSIDEGLPTGTIVGDLLNDLQAELAGYADEIGSRDQGGRRRLRFEMQASSTSSAAAAVGGGRPESGTGEELFTVDEHTGIITTRFTLQFLCTP